MAKEKKAKHIFYITSSFKLVSGTRYYVSPENQPYETDNDDEARILDRCKYALRPKEWKILLEGGKHASKRVAPKDIPDDPVVLMDDEPEEELETLGKKALMDIGKDLGLELKRRMSRPEMVAAIKEARKAG